MLGRAVVITVVFFVGVGAVLFASAGTLGVPAFWAYLGEVILLSIVTLVFVNKRSPDLIAERLHPGAGEQDRIFMTAGVLLSIAHYTIAGADVGRFHRSDSVPFGVQVTGFVGIAAGFCFIAWAMLVNPFFSSAVRMQEDRGQHVITSGPYRFVRHPGYTGGLLYLLCSGVALGSWLSTLPMAAMLPLLIRRTIIEDRMLRLQLTGYTEYARSVRYRILPGIW